MVEGVAEAFSADGYLANYFAGYVPRHGQIVMAEKVAESIERRSSLVVEAPCGTGKSLAYLVPAICHATGTGEKAVVATANIALQEQLVLADLPTLQKALPWDFSFALLKGRNNYLCKLALHRANLAKAPEIEKWALRTETGDKSELPFDPPALVWQAVSSTYKDCLGRKCRFWDSCFTMRARDEAAACDIIVANYHLVLAHMQYGRVLPDYEVLICDEAHKLADITREFLGFKITKGSFLSLLEGKGPAVMDKVRQSADRIFADLMQYYRSGKYKVRVRSTGYLDLGSMPLLLSQLAEHYLAIEDPLYAERCLKLRARLVQAARLADDNHVVHLEIGQKQELVLKSTPIYVAKHLAAGLFAPRRTTIITSATLGTNGAFDYLKGEIGLPDAPAVLVQSPFDFAKQAVLVIPDNMPDPVGEEAKYRVAVGEALAWIIEQTRGRVLFLSTSYRGLELAYARVKDCGYTVLKQGDMPRSKLVEQFKADESSVLLGTESFWAGVDVPGPALSCVVIDRLPFPTPDNPVLAAIGEREGGAFYTHFLPRATIALKQGFGRLIRAAGDRGAVVLLDKRVLTKGYGKRMLQSLPPVPVSCRWDSIVEMTQ